MAKKTFFDLAVKLKNNFAENHPAQSVFIARLYDDVKKNRIEPNKWQ